MTTVRICFEKIGTARYISHLDLNRTMTRALRRARIPLWYTEGFNRHPYVTFAAPLSLGFEGLRESMDFRLEEDMPMEEIAGRLNAVLPAGLRVVEAAEAVMKPGDIEKAAYRLTFSCCADKLEALLSQDSIPVEKRTKKGGTKQVELKPYLSDIRLSAADQRTTVAELILPCGSNETLNPGLLLQALQEYTGEEDIGCSVLRTNLFAKNGDVWR